MNKQFFWTRYRGPLSLSYLLWTAHCTRTLSSLNQVINAATEKRITRDAYTRRRLNNFTHNRCHSAFIFNSACNSPIAREKYHPCRSTLWPLSAYRHLYDKQPIVKQRLVDFQKPKRKLIFYRAVCIFSINNNILCLGICVRKHWMFLLEYSMHMLYNKNKTITLTRN